MSDETDRPAAADIADCESEQIHIPGAILPHGAMLVLDGDTFEVIQVAGDVTGLLGLAAAELLGRSIDDFLRPDQAVNVRGLCASLPLLKPRHLLDPQLRVVATQPLDASLHRSDGALVLEFEAADTRERFADDPLAGVQEMIDGLDGATSIEALCQMAAERVRSVALYDRVLVYRFMQDESGWVIAESRAESLEAFLDLHYPAADIPSQARALYVKNNLRLITQVNYEPARLTPPHNPRTGQPLDMSQAILRDVSPIHREYLRNMGIDASMSISIIIGGQLWGLIACHHYSPRRLPRHIRAICELFGSMFSYQLEVFERREQFNARLASRMVLQNLMLNLASADDYARGLTEQSPNLLDYIHGGGARLDGSVQGGVAVAVKGQLTCLGITPTSRQIDALVAWLNTHLPFHDGVFATDRLAEVWPQDESFASVAAGLLVISVSPDPSDFIIWFRPELVGTSLWAGRPGKSIEGQRLSPRKSFEVWKETVRGRGLPWTSADIDAAKDLRLSLLNVVLRRINTAARERKLAADRDQLLMAELDHRVKNTLANIQALVVQTSASAVSLTGFVEGLEARIQSMAKAHSLLSQSRWEGVSITSLLTDELDPYVRGRAGCVIRGPDFVLTPKSGLALSLAIHELSTNAVKFGALSVSAGRIVVSWSSTETGGIQLVWTELGGPRVLPPKRRGFGTTLIERALAMETDGSAKLEYRPEGVFCEIYLPAAAIVATETNTKLLAAIHDADGTQARDKTAVQSAAKRILVVEDSFMLVGTLELVFDTLGWVMVGPATRVAKALELVETETFDAVLLDVNLDGEMSWGIAAILQERGCPFVLTTGYAVETIWPDFLRGTKTIRKPYMMNELEQTIRELLGEATASSAPGRPLS